MADTVLIVRENIGTTAHWKLQVVVEGSPVLHGYDKAGIVGVIR